jgi:hypothetical protein
LRNPRFTAAVVRQVEIEAKYAGYIELSRRQIERFRRMEDRLIPPDVDYWSVRHLRHEARLDHRLGDAHAAKRLCQPGRICFIQAVRLLQVRDCFRGGRDKPADDLLVRCWCEPRSTGRSLRVADWVPVHAQCMRRHYGLARGPTVPWVEQPNLLHNCC